MPAPKITSYKYGFKDPEKIFYQTKPGLSLAVVEEISYVKNEPNWMREFRLKSLEIFESKPMPAWGADLSGLDFQKIIYFARSSDKKVRDWRKVPSAIRKTYDRLGVPAAERAFLAGVEAQYDSEVVYGALKKEWESKGVIFCDTDTAVQKYPDIVKRYFATVVPPYDNKLAALNSAVWSGGSFVYVPAGVELDMPVQAYFRINRKSLGQFERTLIIAEEGSSVHYVEGCTAPIYTEDSLHAAVVEVIAKRGSRVRYTTIQNWSPNVYNLVTKRAHAFQDATVEWVDGNLGSKKTMKYPSVFMFGEGARGDVLSIAVAGPGQHQDAGAKAIHLAPNTSSTITSKSISFGGGRTTYRGMVKVMKGARGVKSNVRCDALILDPESRSDTVPVMNIYEPNVSIAHEATVSRVNESQLFYLQSRGLKEPEATALIVNGFLDPITKQLPLEYAVELNRLIEMEMEGSVG
jgi:Fe-S cluster assembly protein SufB